MLERMDIYNLALRPNCLMTRNPLVFITGPRSLFFYEKLGGTLQDFVAAHGYVVLNPVLPFRGSFRPVALIICLPPPAVTPLHTGTILRYPVIQKGGVMH